MKNIIFLLFTSLLASSLIVGCGGDGGGSSDPKTVILPNTSTPSSTEGKTDKPEDKVTPGCEENVDLPNCKK